MIDQSVQAALVLFVMAVLPLLLNWLLSKVEPNFVERSEAYTKEIEEFSRVWTEAFAELDKIRCELDELESKRVAKLKSLEELEHVVNNRQELLDSLKNVSFPVVTHFLEEARKGEKKSAMRDYVLFVLGIVLGIFINLILKRF